VSTNFVFAPLLRACRDADPHAVALCRVRKLVQAIPTLEALSEDSLARRFVTKLNWLRLVARIGGIVAVAIVIWFVAGFFSAQRACAHDPRFACSPRGPSDPVRIKDPSKSWAFYGHLRKGETDVYEITVDRSAQIPWSLLVDRRDAGNPARPFFTLSTADGRLLQTTDFAHSERFYEPFSREQYSTTPTTILSLEAGRYSIAIRMCGTNEQRYTLAIGSVEHFGISEIPYVLGSIHRIRAQQY
jgi:hypothetical protein